MVYKRFYKTSPATRAKKSTTLTGKGINFENQELAEQLHKLVIRKLKKDKVYSSFRDSIWGDDVPDMQFISTYDKGIQFLSCVIDIYSNCTWDFPLKGKNRITIANAFQKSLEKSYRKARKTWVDKCMKFIIDQLNRGCKIMI